MESVKKRTAAVYIAVIAAFAVLVTTLGIGVFYIDKSNLQNKLKLNNYQQSLNVLNESLDEIEDKLSKLMISQSKSESTALLNDICQSAQIAQSSLRSLNDPPAYSAVKNEERVKALKPVFDIS